MSKRYQAGILTASYNGLKVPNAPTIGTATAGAGSASVTFTAPSDVGGGAITSYTVISSPGSITGTGSSSPVTVSGLTNGTAYTFTVVATNAYGTGPASAASNSVTPSLNYIEEVFSTYLYTGNGTSQSIVNGIDVSTYGGMTWIKNRSTDTGLSVVHDTARGTTQRLSTNLTDAQVNLTGGIGLTAFNSNGFTVGTGTAYNGSGNNLASWTFRKQPKFFDVVTYTGNGAAGQTINHNLGSVPGFMVVKRTNTTGDWAVYHRSLGATQICFLNDTQAAGTTVQAWNNTEPTSTQFTVGVGYNASGSTYVAYLYAHNAGGFGLTGTDNVISCGSFTTDGSGNATVNLGYEPQWVLYKRSSSAGNWLITDNMRGDSANATNNANYLLANTSDAEGTATWFYPTATGFTGNANSIASTDFIYIAIRRGPMKVPTSGTSVFSPVAETPSGSANYVMNSSSGFPVDMLLYKERNNVATPYLTNRLTNNYLQTASTAAEASYTYGYDLMQGVRGQFNAASQVDYAFRRAPSFFDEVCYTGTGNVGSDATRITHNLGVAPELIIVKGRTNAVGWPTYTATGGVNSLLLVNATDASSAITGIWATTAPTSTTFGVSNGGGTYNNGGGVNYVAYLFATCAGVSKVGSYTGTGTTKQVDCGFTGGARFVLIKRTDSTGDWYVWDSARGIVAGNDPYLLLNSTAAEVTNTDYVDTYSAGFEISSTAPAAINANGGTYIYLAIA